MLKINMRPLKYIYSKSASSIFNGVNTVVSILTVLVYSTCISLSLNTSVVSQLTVFVLQIFLILLAVVPHLRYLYFDFVLQFYFYF